MAGQKHHWGLDGFVWWIGVVEDRMDPLQCGRCKVRIFGHHIEDKSEMPTEDLPWCCPIVSLDPGRCHVTGPKEGDWVMGFFKDGKHKQFPVMMGIVPGWPEEPADPSIGYEDPRPDSLMVGHQVPREPSELIQHDDGSGNDIFEQDVTSRFPDEHFLPEPDTTRYERGYDGGFIDKTVVPKKIDNVAIGQTDVPTGAHPAGTGTDVESPETTWTERATQYNTKYPYNHCYFSEGGHIIEIDDTPFAERLHFYHRVGTFMEIDPVGALVEKIVDEEYRICLQSRHVHIEAADEETVDWYKKVYVNKDGEAGFNYDQTVGPGGDFNITTEDGKLNIYLNGDWNVYVIGSAYIETEENLVAMVHKEAHVTVDESAYVHVKENLNVVVNGDVNAQVDGNVRAYVGGNWTGFIEGNKTQYVGGNYKLIVAGNIDMLSGGSIRNAALASINNSSAGPISSKSGTQISHLAPLIVSQAGLEVANIAPLVSLTAAVVSCPAQLLGVTVDDDGDITPPGPPSFQTALEPAFPTVLTSLVTDAIEAEVVDIEEDTVENLIQEAMDAINNEAEEAAEAAAAAAAANASSASGSGGPKGGIFVDGPGGFLWKPTGANSGVLTVLTPGTGAAVYQAVADGEESKTKKDGSIETKVKYKRGGLIENLRHTGVFEGDGRNIYRGEKAGGSYGGGKPVYCIAGGQEVFIEFPSMRYD